VLVRLDPVCRIRRADLRSADRVGDRYRRLFRGPRHRRPKTLAAVSPKKTWAGAIGGFYREPGVAAALPRWSRQTGPAAAARALFSVASQLGDLFESAVKRRFGVKDSSQIIPGHGGLLDRLDGFVAASSLAALFGFLRGGADGVGRGLMVW
jgi:phosphatidate cytidylyltransferase